MSYKKRNTEKVLPVLIVVIVTIVYLLTQCHSKYENNAQTQTQIADGECEITMIDVGQGDSFLVTTPEGNLLFDAGPNKSENTLKSFLDEKGITSFEYLILSHPDEDHIGGGDMIMKNFDVKNVLMPDVQNNSQTFENVLNAILNSDADFETVKAGYKFSVGKFSCEVLSPMEDYYSDTNRYSIVVKATYDGFSILFTGDADTSIEKDLISKYGSKLSCDVLKCGHHGSKTATSEEFLKLTDPTIALISVGAGNSYGHPSDETLELLEKYNILTERTDTMGSVTIATDGQTYWLKK